MRKGILFNILIISCLCGTAQLPFRRADTIKVFKNSQQLQNPWVGGHNFVQVSDIDLDLDGIKDLFVFDRTGNKITTYINTGTANTVSYVHKPEYEKKFPPLQNWALLYDYNGDGLEDIFHFNGAGFAVHKNVSTIALGLQWQLISNLIYSEYSPNNWVNLYVSPVDLPGLADIDNDGDMDVATFSINGISVEYHKNLAVELGLGPDSLHFKYMLGNWGEFTENPSNCGINLQRVIPEQPEPQHAGSCLLCLDMDDDNDQELILGDISCCSMAMLTNGGDTSYADFVNYDALFPSNSMSVDMSLFPCGFHVDVNNDNKRDLIVGASAQNVSENRSSIWYYENTGTDQLPVFTFVENDFLQKEMIDVGEGAFPSLIDYDADGLIDLLVSNTYYRYQNGNCNTSIVTRIAAYKNTGTATSPVYTHQTDNWNNLDADLTGIITAYPAFGDLDNDGDLDMMLGDDNGKLHYFPNTAGAGNPIAFGAPVLNYMDDAFTVIDVGNNASPQFIDLDLDTKLDMIIGEKGGNINYYKNVGTTAIPSFQFVTDTLGDVDVTPLNSFQGYSTPFIYLDSGQFELLIGSEMGVVYHYSNITGNIAGTWSLDDSLGGRYYEIFEGIRTNPQLKDVNADGVLDLVIGNYRGGLGFYLGDLTTGFAPSSENIQLQYFPNPSTGQLTIVNSVHENLELKIFSVDGKQCFKGHLMEGKTSIDLHNLPSGVYVMRASGKSSVFTGRLMLTEK